MSEPLKIIAGTPDSPLVIGDIEIPCYVLENEVRVLSQRGTIGALGMSVVSGTGRGGAHRVLDFLSSNALKPHCDKDLLARTSQRIEFVPGRGGRTAYGYPATLLVDICNAVLDARKAGAIQRNQEHIADRCEVLVRGFATVGIIALVDEATGYQRIREERALATILEKFVAEKLQPWTRTFPYEFYEQIFRLKGWDGPVGKKRPPLIGHYTNDIVYARLAPGVLDELQARNPVMPAGYRKSRHHQWFTPDLGHPRLREHLAAVIALMRAAPNWDSFKRSLTRAFPKVNENLPLWLERNE